MLHLLLTLHTKRSRMFTPHTFLKGHCKFEKAWPSSVTPCKPEEHSRENANVCTVAVIMPVSECWPSLTICHWRDGEGGGGGVPSTCSNMLWSAYVETACSTLFEKNADVSIMETRDSCLVLYQESMEHRLNTSVSSNVTLHSLQDFHFGNHNTEVKKITWSRHICTKYTKDIWNEDNSLESL
jgi:hypothetical protein